MAFFNRDISFKKEVLERIIRSFYSQNFEDKTRLIPLDMRPKGSEALYRCCIFKERAILKDRVIAGLGFAIENDDESMDLSEYAKKALERQSAENNPLTVITTACKGCVPNRIYVTDLCQGCLAKPCRSACKFNAISINAVNGRSIIDNGKCKICKMCLSACPYNAIVKIAVPCEDVCPVDAIKKSMDGNAEIDYGSCIYCGKCIRSCPFGAVHEKSQIIDVLKNIVLKKKVIGLIAPSSVGHFQGSVYQLKTAIKKAGFSDVYEVAQGADVTTRKEAQEFEERIKKGQSFMTTSCCAGYNQLVKKHLPKIGPFKSDTKTPLYYIAQKVKNEQADCITVFISPCVAKKQEAAESPNVNYVINFEELNVLFLVKKINVQDCKEEIFDVESSKQGRGFGVVGGVAGAVSKALEGKDLTESHIINGLNKDSIKRLKKAADEKKFLDGNLIEVMCCEGGCVCGNAAICDFRTAQRAVKTFLERSKDLV